MELITHAIFPTLVLESYYDKNEEFLKKLHKTWSDHYHDGYSSELTNDLDLHLDARYTDLYSYLSKCVLEFLKISGTDSSVFNINFVKSWFNALDTMTTPVHSHADAHISIVYYANIPIECQQYIRFHYSERNREPYSGIFRFNHKNSTEFNSFFYNIKPYQGQVLIFPGGIYHDTVHIQDKDTTWESPVFSLSDFKNKRICIASDVVLTYKEQCSKPMGLQPLSNWRRFE